jgi:hypothetical protein
VLPLSPNKGSNLQKNRIRLTRFGRQVRSVVLSCAFIGVYLGAIESANASQQRDLEAQRVFELRQQQELSRSKLRAVSRSESIDLSNLDNSNQFVDFDMSNDSLINILKSAGFEGEYLKQAWAIVMKESSGNHKALNDNPRTGDLSYGLFQINMIGKLGPDRLDRYGLSSYEDLYNPNVNARVAYSMSNGGRNWGPWNVGRNAYDRGGRPDINSYRYWLNKYPY